MELQLSEDQEMLCKSAHGLLARAAPLGSLGAREFDPESDDSSLWGSMVSLGWVGLTVPLDLGGGGGTMMDLELLCEVMGSHLVSDPFLPVAVAAAAALERGSEPAARDLLAALVRGSRPVLAVPENHGSWEPAAMSSHWDGHHVSGTKRFVQSASSADVLIVAATGPSGRLGLVGVDRRDPGVTLTPLPGMSGSVWFDVELNNAAGEFLGGGWEAVEHALTRVAAMQAAWCAGGAKQLLQDTVAYVTERHQFGAPIGSFQAVQHRLADCDVAVAESETLARLAASLLDDKSPAARRMASTAFVRATEAFVQVARSCHQVWGGIGFCTEAHVHLFSRRAKVAQHLWGGPRHHLAIVADELRRTPSVLDRYLAVHPEGIGAL